MLEAARPKLIRRSNSMLKPYAAWAAVCFFWGTTYLAIRVAVESYPAAFMAGVRFIVAGSVLLIVLMLRGHPLPETRELRDMAVVGIALLTIANGLVVWSEQWVPSSLAAVIVATLPFWVAGIESALPNGERITWRKVVGILIGFAGLLILLGPDLGDAVEPDYLKGIFGLLLAPLSWAGGSVYSKYRRIQATPLMAASLHMLIGGAVLVVIGVAFGQHLNLAFHPRGLAAILYLIVFGSIVGYACFVYALDKLPSSTVALYAYINPIVAIILGRVVLNERMDLAVVVGTGIIFLGVYYVQTAGLRAKVQKAKG
jgi:drug/metabolite transporter (DMT)-like permease